MAKKVFLKPELTLSVNLIIQFSKIEIYNIFDFKSLINGDLYFGKLLINILNPYFLT
jgi:hypothetical protein